MYSCVCGQCIYSHCSYHTGYLCVRDIFSLRDHLSGDAVSHPILQFSLDHLVNFMDEVDSQCKLDMQF